MSEQKNGYVVVIGGALMDVIGFPEGKLVAYDSAPGKVHLVSGGVGRNIAENLARLGVTTRLITVFGDDAFSKMLIRRTQSAGVDVKHSKFLKGKHGPLNLAVQNEENNMLAGVAELDLFEELSISFLKEKMLVIQAARYIVLETNLPAPSIKFVLQNASPPVFVDPVSSYMVEKLSGQLGQIHTLKGNDLEMGVLAGIEINSEKDQKEAIDYFLNKGIQSIFITAGSHGLCCSDADRLEMIKVNPLNAINTTGAGDAFMAGIVIGAMKNMSITARGQMGIAAARIAIQHLDPVNPEMSAALLHKTWKEIGGGLQ